ncbi:MAG TPA: 16S rRNA (uracil(1498)-N(3))-methyltransferase [Ktedonobacteraceae bacterium]|nr:16S rRNA (uracil(1498)-N(3))-methyltransferase [Ktedonobacteraceae bacterium]
MHRFFIEPSLLQSSSITLPESLAHQVRDVLRLQVGEQLVLLDNSGDEISAAISGSARAGVIVRVVERRPGKAEPRVRITLCQGMLKSARFEWILEKGVELGVTTFVPILCRRSTAGLEEVGAAKIQRWQRIIQEAAEQCGRARLPALLPIRSLPLALSDIPPGALAIIPWEEERDHTLHAVAAEHAAPGKVIGNNVAAQFIAPVFIFIGPEGGLTAEEVQLARQHGVQPITLGSRILRAETAALAAVANVLYEFE